MSTPESLPDRQVFRLRPLTIFQTADVNVAAYLRARAHSLLRVDWIEDTAIFTFSSEAALSADAFYQGATVCAKSLLYAARQLEQLRNNKINVHHSA
jgi:hypothetical protein